MPPLRAPAWLLAALLILPFLAAAPGAAWGHASLIETTPADGAVLAKAPAAITLTFSEPISPLVLKLDGTAVSTVPSQSGAAVLDIVPPDGIGPGTHVLTWRVVSEDGHPVGGTVTFSIGAPDSAATSPADPIHWPVDRVVDGEALPLSRPFPRSWRRLRRRLARPRDTPRRHVRPGGRRHRSGVAAAADRLPGAGRLGGARLHPG
ncbi:copper resistance CopC family protein [Skermanella stibiiresistens]|uniref:copper resistance CopC family protein n=1 Tax=Skermanella stibiiresistens TaxID=913326 RepID=UPI0004AD34F6|nr:copper resistance protein CopC [Skermanella stibiiresistens]